MNALKAALRKLAIRDARFEILYRKIGKPGGLEWAEMLRERGDFYAMGHDCYIEPGALIEDRAYIRLGNNVRMAGCTILGHDGSVNMINYAFGLKLDSVGKVDIRDNVFIGQGAIILPGVTIGPNAVVAAGSVVRSDVAEGNVVVGVPAKPVGRLEMSVAMLKAKNEKFPWRDLIEGRQNEYDLTVEAELIRQRTQYFYGAPKGEANQEDKSK
jgi:acetyltransferase-like isoleucine patch superfamily enzyme